MAMKVDLAQELQKIGRKYPDISPQKAAERVVENVPELGGDYICEYCKREFEYRIRLKNHRTSCLSKGDCDE